MEIEKTPLWREALDIIENGDILGIIGWSAIIHLGTPDSEILIPLQVNALNLRRDYNLAYADEFTCTLSMPLGKYARRVYPNRNTLQITLTKTYLKGTSKEIDYSKPVETERYTATLIDERGGAVEGQGRESNTEDALDLVDILDVNFQLYNKNIEQIRMMTVGAVFRSTNMHDVIKTVLSNEASKSKVDTKLKIQGVDIIPVSNKEKHEQVVITHGVKLTDVPNFLQNKYGVYNSGLGSYIQGNLWYVFPMYDTSQFEKRENNVTILVLPTSKCPEIERSFKKKGASVTILVSSDTNFKEDTANSYLNTGNGVRIGDANSFMENHSATKDNKTTIARKKTNSEFITDSRPDGCNNVLLPSNRITANPFTTYSDLVSRNGGVFKAIWNNSDISLIIPGMMAKIVYFDQDKVCEIYGVVLAMKHTSLKVGDVKSQRHTTNSCIYVFVNRKIK